MLNRKVRIGGAVAAFVLAAYIGLTYTGSTII